MKFNSQLLLILPALLLLAFFCLWGAEPIHLYDLFDSHSISHRIVFDLRAPRLLTVAIIGGTLSLLGATYQILFHNPLAEPYVLGVSSAVTLGMAVASLVLGVSTQSAWAALTGFGFGGLLTLALMSLSLGSHHRQMERLILFGMASNFVFSSCLFLLLSYVNQQLGAGSMRWIFGQVGWASWTESIYTGLLCLPFLIALLLLGRHLDALSMGDMVARTLGFDPVRARRIILILSSAVLGIAVFFSGAIGFVGLVVPNFVRLVFRPSTSRQLLLLSFGLGSLFLGLSDVVARRLLPPLEFPLGIITTLVGGPIFLWLLGKRR